MLYFTRRVKQQRGIAMYTVIENITGIKYTFDSFAAALDFCDDVMESYWGGYVNKIDLTLYEYGKQLAHKILD